jgi:hypothetical protein
MERSGGSLLGKGEAADRPNTHPPETVESNIASSRKNVLTAISSFKLNYKEI